MKNKQKNKNEIKVAEPETPAAARRANTIAGLIVALLVGLSFYIRGIIPLERAMLKEGLTFAMDDAVFHMRLVENTIANFPNRIFYDAFTNYPYGNQLHWGALFEQTIAIIAIVAGRIFDGGAPSQATINTVGAFYPAVLGALVVIPAYIIAKELSGRKGGIIAAALTAILPGQFLSRSVLGFTDNHIAEVLFLSLSVMFFVIALKRAKTITFDTVISKNWAELKSPLTYSILTGLALGVYILNWTAGIFLVVVFTLFFVVQIVINHIKKTSSQHLVILSVPMMVIPTLLVIPYVEIRNSFDSAYYSLLHISVPLMAVAIVGIMYAISLKMNRMGLARIFYPVVILFVAWIGLNIISIVLPDLYSTIMGSIKMMFSARTGGQLTVAEAVPLNKETALAYFGSSYYLAFLGLLVLAYNGLVKRLEEHTLIAVWSIFILAITLAQVRFSYYYAINVAVMAAVFAGAVLDLVGWKNYNMNNLNNLSTVSSITKGIKIIPVIVLAGFIAGMFFLPAGASIYKTSTSMTKSGALSAGYFEWYFAMDWMKNNTPDTGVDYLGTYERPPKGEKYPYPDTAYGVMSWWDYGHIITYWGHRIPNANPFQASVPEVAAFLTAQSEEEGNAVMDRLGSKYVVTDSFMAYGIQTIFATWLNDKAIVDPFEGGKQNISGYYYSAIRTNEGVMQIPALKTFKSMTGRLHILDTIGLKQYRLIHETSPSVNSMNAKIGAGVEQEKRFKFVYNQLFKQTLPQEDSGYVKIFEYVKGAQITGTAPANTQVEVSLNIKTNVGRDIAYRQWVVSDSNGNFEITVPYSTVGAENGQTKFDTKATGKYNIRAKDITKEFDVDELDVLNGRIIPIDIR